MNFVDTVFGGSTVLQPFIARLIVYLVPVAVFTLFGILLERCLIADKNENNEAKLFNLVISLTLSLTDVCIGISLVAWITSAVKRVPLHGVINIPLHDHGRMWLAIPLALLSICIGDFFYYWMHRAQHTWGWLWVQHKLHQTDEHMNVTTTLRAHWTEVPIHILFINAPLALFFKLPIITLGLASLLMQSVKYFIHLNARISFGPLNRIFCSPHTHRIHHSSMERHWGKNFSSAFSLWDVLFGTYYQPAKEEWPPCGVPEEKNHSVINEMIMPLREWSRMLRSAAVNLTSLYD